MSKERARVCSYALVVRCRTLVTTTARVARGRGQQSPDKKVTRPDSLRAQLEQSRAARSILREVALDPRFLNPMASLGSTVNRLAVYVEVRKGPLDVVTAAGLLQELAGDWKETGRVVVDELYRLLIDRAKVSVEEMEKTRANLRALSRTHERDLEFLLDFRTEVGERVEFLNSLKATGEASATYRWLKEFGATPDETVQHCTLVLGSKDDQDVKAFDQITRRFFPRSPELATLAFATYRQLARTLDSSEALTRVFSEAPRNGEELTVARGRLRALSEVASTTQPAGTSPGIDTVEDGILIGDHFLPGSD